MADEAGLEIELVQIVGVKAINFAALRCLKFAHLELQLLDEVFLVIIGSFSHFGTPLVLRGAALLDVLFLAWLVALHQKSAEAVGVFKIAVRWR